MPLEVSLQKCPVCGGKNLTTASSCSQCGRPLAQLTQAASLADMVTEMRRGRQGEKKMDGEIFRSEGSSPDGLHQVLDREFVRPEPVNRRNRDASLDPSSKAEYHPLAERALEKVKRVRLQTAAPPPQPATAGQPSPANPDPANLIKPDVTPPIRKMKSPATLEKGKVERIEISLSQGILPFDPVEAQHAPLQEDLIASDLTAAPLSTRLMAGMIDTLFVLGCFLLFLGIVFFLPDFSFLSRSSFLGMGAVLSLISAAYLFLFITTGAQTLGMEYEGLKVVSFDGRSPSMREIGLRVFGSFTSLGCFMLGFIWAFFDPDRLTWHDRISKTLVVQKP